MESGYKIYIRLGRLFIAKYIETNQWFVGWTLDKCYKELLKMR